MRAKDKGNAAAIARIARIVYSSRATDFGSGIALTWESTQRESTVWESTVWESTIRESTGLGPPILDLELHLPVLKKNYEKP